MELSTTVTNWLWFGFFGMAAGTVALYLLSFQLKAVEKYHAYTAAAITSIAALAYYAMANGQAVLMVNNKSVFLARYIDWLITTPLLILSLVFLAYSADKDSVGIRQKLGVVASAIFADMVMIVTGVFANLSSDSSNRNFWYVIGCLAFIVVLGVLYGPVRSSAKSLSVSSGKAYTNLLNYLMVLFFVYPIVWVFGTSGNSTISLNSEVAIYAVLDLLAKVGFGLLIVKSVKNLKSAV